MKKIAVVIISIFALTICIIAYKKCHKYSELLEECANMYPNHFEEMCLWN